MKHPIVTMLNVAALVFMVVVWVAAPSFVKQNAFLFWGVFILTAIRLASTLLASSQEEQLDQQVLATQQKAEQAVQSSGQAAATVWLYRVSSLLGREDPIAVYCDDGPMAVMPNGSYTFRKVAPGEHALFWAVVARSAPMRLTLEPGQDYFIRIAVTGLLKRIAFETVPKQQAQSEMNRLKEVN
jgi:hypothetical protein